MADTTHPHRLPIARIVVWMTLVALIVIGLGAWMSVSFEWMTREQTLLFAGTGAAVWLVCVSSLLLASLLGGGTGPKMTIAFFAASVARMMITIGGAVLAGVILRERSTPMLAAIVAVYLPLLAVESISAGRWMLRSGADRVVPPIARS